MSMSIYLFLFWDLSSIRRVQLDSSWTPVRFNQCHVCNYDFRFCWFNSWIRSMIMFEYYVKLIYTYNTLYPHWFRWFHWTLCLKWHAAKMAITTSSCLTTGYACACFSHEKTEHWRCYRTHGTVKQATLYDGGYDVSQWRNYCFCYYLSSVC